MDEAAAPALSILLRDAVGAAVASTGLNGSAAATSTLAAGDDKFNAAVSAAAYYDNASAATAAGDSQSDDHVLRLLIAVQSVIYAVATASNVAVLAVLGASHRRQRLTRMYQLVAHLCLADLAVATFNILPNLLQLAHGTQWTVPSDFLCRSVSYLSLASVYGSTYVLVATAVDRYVAICHPLARAGSWCLRPAAGTGAHALAAVAWVAALAFSTPQLALFRYSYRPEARSHDCWAPFHDDPAERSRRELAYTLWFACAVWFAPMIVLTFCYASITAAVWRSRGRGSCCCGGRSSRGATPWTLCGAGYAAASALRWPRSGATAIAADVALGASATPDGGGSSSPPSAKDSAATIDSCDVAAGLLTKRLIPSRASSATAEAAAAGAGRRRWMSAETRRTVRLTLTVITSYVLCWSPWMVSMLVTSVVTERSDDPVLGALQDLAYIITYFIGVNSCVNPWICLWFNLKRLCNPKVSKPLRWSSRSAGTATGVVGAAPAGVAATAGSTFVTSASTPAANEAEGT